ncbi:uncharacterized protein [Spinacia oleracea]|uniref:DUF4283 domain-containing protein n=1 Tax=Spinacia oleracea TaxID=3562 RepID=A0ABM3QQA0_SPIOL|nr:uncharacterized protein LOC110804260 [Spinacia oleracea]
MGSPSKPPDDLIMHDPKTSPEQSQEDNQPKSFREAIASSSQWFREARKIIATSLDWEDKEEVPPEDSLVVKFDKFTLSKLRQPWRMILMGKCMGIQVKASYMETRVKAMWRVKGLLEVIDIGKQVFLFKFTQPDDYERALFGGPWPSVNSFDCMLVWIRIEELPVEYYDKDALFEIAKLVGKPIRVDYATDKITRAKFARVCVETDLLNPLITRVWVGGQWQQIVYENITSLFKCGRIGHVTEMCDIVGDHNMDKGYNHGDPNKKDGL